MFEQRIVLIPLRTGESVPVVMVPKLTRSLKLSYHQAKKSFILSHPTSLSDDALFAFMEDHHDWFVKTYNQKATRKIITIGDDFVFLGKKYVLQKDKLRKKGIFEDGDTIWVGSHLQDSVPLEKFLKQKAKTYLDEIAEDYATKLGVSFEKITVRDTSTRWGSCSSAKTLSFSWRLGFAPVKVTNYVVAHEVAHLLQMNHSPAFWALVQGLCPQYKAHKKWLKQRGADLIAVEFILD